MEPSYDLLSEAVGIVDSTFLELGESVEQVRENLGPYPRRSLEDTLKKVLKENFGSSAAATLQADFFDAQITLTVNEPEGNLESVKLGVPPLIKKVIYLT